MEFAGQYEQQMNGSYGLGSESWPYKYQNQFGILIRHLNERDKTMTHKFFIAVSALVFFTTAAASAASAEVNVDLNLNLGGGYPSYYPEPYPVYPPYPALDDNYYDYADCGYEYITVKKWNRYHTRYRIVHKRVWVCN